MSQQPTDSTIEPRLDAYHFYEREWDSYEELRDAFEWEVPEQFNIATYVCDRWAEADPDRVAVYATEADGTETEYTYGQLRSDANRLANYLEAQGVAPGDRIGVNGSQRVAFLVTHLAAWKLGAVSIPLSVLFGPDGLKYRLADGGAVAYVVDETSLHALREIKDDLDELETILPVGDVDTDPDETGFWSAIEGQPQSFETVTTDAEDTALLMYTSGTTGPPKGVVHAHRGLLGILPGFLTTMCNMELREDDVARGPVEWSWAGSLNDLVLPCLFYGIPVVAHAGGEFDPNTEFDLIDRYDIAIHAGPATALRGMMQVDEPDVRYDLSSIRTVVQGGEALGQTIVTWLQHVFDDVAVHEAYGQTEAPLFVGDCEELGVAHRPGQMGKPMPGHDVRVVDIETGGLVESGEVGELALRYEQNPVCFTAFRNAPEETERRIQNDWLLTEDIGSKEEDGYFSFHSRKDDVIISSGYRIGPGEIEESLAGHDAVANAGVIGVPDETRGEIPKAYVVLAGEYEPSDELKADLQTYVKDRLAKYEYPREIEFIDELPKTTTGKVRRRDLREREGLIEAGGRSRTVRQGNTP